MTKTYEDILKAVVSKLDSDGADSEEEWAGNILRSIGITPESHKKTADLCQAVTALEPDLAPWVNGLCNGRSDQHKADKLNLAIQLAKDF